VEDATAEVASAAAAMGAEEWVAEVRVEASRGAVD
jgi:hypothetical protein